MSFRDVIWEILEKEYNIELYREKVKLETQGDDIVLVEFGDKYLKIKDKRLHDYVQLLTQQYISKDLRENLIKRLYVLKYIYETDEKITELYHKFFERIKRVSNEDIVKEIEKITKKYKVTPTKLREDLLTLIAVERIKLGLPIVSPWYSEKELPYTSEELIDFFIEYMK